MTTTVCADGQEFIVNDGELALKIAGGKHDIAWPYPCSVAAFNSLVIDTATGLWVPPSPTSSTGHASTTSTDTPLGIANGDNYSLEFDFHVIDPSTCLLANALLIFEIDYTYELSEAQMNLVVFFDNGDGSGYDGGDARASYHTPTTPADVIIRDTAVVIRSINSFSGNRSCKFKAQWSNSQPGTVVLSNASISGTQLVVNSSTSI